MSDNLREQHMREAYDWAFFNTPAGERKPVDHSAPIHDSFCRCRTCKPPMPGEQASRAYRARIIIAAAILVWLAIIAAYHAL